MYSREISRGREFDESGGGYHGLCCVYDVEVGFRFVASESPVKGKVKGKVT